MSDSYMPLASYYRSAAAILIFRAEQSKDHAIAEQLRAGAREYLDLANSEQPEMEEE